MLVLSKEFWLEKPGSGQQPAVLPLLIPPQRTQHQAATRRNLLANPLRCVGRMALA